MGSPDNFSSSYFCKTPHPTALYYSFVFLFLPETLNNFLHLYLSLSKFVRLCRASLSPTSKVRVFFFKILATCSFLLPSWSSSCCFCIIIWHQFCFCNFCLRSSLLDQFSVLRFWSLWFVVFDQPSPASDRWALLVRWWCMIWFFLFNFFLLFCVSDFWLVFCVWIVLAYNIIIYHGDGGCDHNHNLFHRQLAI